METLSKIVKTTMRQRINFFLIPFFLFLAILLIRYASIMIPSSMGSKDNPQFTKIQRGNIYDRNGRLLAIQTRLDTVTGWIPDIKDKEKSAAILSEVLKLDEKTLLDRLNDPARQGFLYIKRQISLTESKHLKTYLNRGELPGISVQPAQGRNYPEKNLAAPVLGYVGTDNTGLDGIEYTFNNTLLPPSIASQDNQIKYGNDVYLTIDLNTQYLVEQIAQKAYTLHKPESLMITIMDANSGDLLSMVSLPSFDPNKFSSYSNKQRSNLPVTLTYEPGSVMKIFSIASFLELGGITPTSEFETSKGYNPDLFKKYHIPPITDLGNYKTIDTEGILIHSSNVGTALASERVTSAQFYNMLKNFGFGKSTGLPLPGESNGILNDSSKWSIRSKPTIAIGQEIGVSAIQMTSAATVFANSGILLKPHIVKKVLSPEGKVIKEFKREPLREVVSPEVAKTVLNMMEKVVSSPTGTVRRARVEGLHISAKSGTAQKVDPTTGKYSDKNFTASVLALFPTEKPKLIVYAVLESPRGSSYYGGRIVSPIVKEIIQTLAPFYGVPLKENTIINYSNRVEIEAPKKVDISNFIMPNLIGFSKRDILRNLEQLDLKYELQGEGHVKHQSIAPGTRITEDSILTLEFS